MDLQFWSLHKDKRSEKSEVKETPLSLRISTYMMSAFFTLHFVLPLYVNSNFLDSIVSETTTSLIYIVAAILAIATMSVSADMLPKLGNFWSMLIFLVLELAAVAILAIPTAPVALLIGAFIAHWILTAIIRFNIDVFLEHFSTDAETGNIRGSVIALNHVSYIIGPLLAGFILSGDTFWQMYLVSAVLVVPPLVILIKKFRNFADPVYENASLFKSVQKVWQDVNVRFALGAMFVLRLFFAWMIVYTPIYLHKYIGLSFSEIGIIFSIMLVPFVLFGQPLGRIADKWLGEKELLIGGFIITAIFTASLSLVTAPSILIWGALLFGTRTGATMIQVMSEGYFFKHVESADIHAISVLRMIRPAAYTIAPILASLMLLFAPFSGIFLGISVALILGALISLPIVDTR
ncbi:MAG: MFS transporter [Candidatus Paceibacterota bacterium]